VVKPWRRTSAGARGTGYPQEWIRDQNGTPRCLAFEPIDKPERCQHTVDMFTGQRG
jgi:hypothetical protein